MRQACPSPPGKRSSFAARMHYRQPDRHSSRRTQASIRRHERPGPTPRSIGARLRLRRRLVDGGDIGIAEAYLRGEWETPNLTQFLELFCVNHELIAKMLEDRPLVRDLAAVPPLAEPQHEDGSRRNIHAHYDLGNTLLRSVARPDDDLFGRAVRRGRRATSSRRRPGRRKYRALAETREIGPDHHVLEIGCGWGGFAEFAGKEIGCRVTGLTISQEQYDYARKRIFEQGLADRVEIRLQDYRDETRHL